MKNNKGIWIAAIVVFLIMVSVVAISIKKNASNGSGTEKTSKKSDTNVITFAIPDICRIDENNLKQFNDALMNDGYDYELNIKYLE